MNINKHINNSYSNKETKIYNSIIIPYDFFSVNEALISDIIKKTLNSDFKINL